MRNAPRGGTSAGRGLWCGTGWRVLDASPDHARQVRDWIGGAVTRDGCLADPDEAALVVSELFANALMHGPACGRVMVGYCLWPGGARIVVGDGGGATTPQIRDLAELDEGGRGLQVVDAVAAAWGSIRIGRAQAVWCDLGKPLGTSPDGEALAWLRAALAGVALAVPRAGAAWLSSACEPGEPPALRGRQVRSTALADAPAVTCQVLGVTRWVLALRELVPILAACRAALPRPAHYAVHGRARGRPRLPSPVRHLSRQRMADNVTAGDLAGLREEFPGGAGTMSG